MAIYEITKDNIKKIEQTTFGLAGLRERYDLQRLLREQIEVISPETLVIAEEFEEWEDSKRRIDLLGLDKQANLVVIELKRTEDGGYMDLQAIRYAAMVSAMTFDKAVEVYAGHLKKLGSTSDARESILRFFGWDEPDEDSFAQDVRVVLVSAEFSKELTTAVMWLNEQGLDVICIRIKPYNDSNRVLVDVQQVIPLPEASLYQVKILEKAQKERLGRADEGGRMALRYRFWEGVLAMARDKTQLHANISPSRDGWISAGSGTSGVHYVYSTTKHNSFVKLFFAGADKDRNKANFDFLAQHRQEIEKTFGEPLEWERCDDQKQAYITKRVDMGGYLSEDTEWPAIQETMVDAMVRLENAIDPFIPKLAGGMVIPDSSG